MLRSGIFSRGRLLRPREIEVHILGDKPRWSPERRALFLIGTNGDIRTSPAIKRRKDTFYLLTGEKSFLSTVYRRKIFPVNAIGFCCTSWNLMESYFPCCVLDDIIGHLCRENEKISEFLMHGANRKFLAIPLLSRTKVDLIPAIEDTTHSCSSPPALRRWRLFC
jgi:hypothetical protein